MAEIQEVDDETQKQYSTTQYSDRLKNKFSTGVTQEAPPAQNQGIF